MATKPNTATSTEKMTWYAWGQIEPHTTEELPSDYFLKEARETIPNLVPTTYEAASAYLREECNKPDGQQPDVLREMCVMVPLGLPEDRKVFFMAPSMGIAYQLKEKCMMFLPTIELPPDTFGTPENRGFLDSNNKLVYDPPTDTRQRGVILLSYFTKSGPDA